MDRPLHLAVIGRQGSGKGTQARLLAERLALTHLSTGDLLRAEATGTGTTAETLRSYLDAGALVPDALVDSLVARAIAAAPNGVVLDGYPRTPSQVAVLDRLVELDLVIELDLRPRDALARLVARRVCPACGESGSALDAEDLDCGRCGTPMVRRADDHPAAVRARLQGYDRATAPLLALYRHRGLLVTVDAGRPVSEVADDVLDVVARSRDRLASAG